MAEVERASSADESADNSDKLGISIDDEDETGDSRSKLFLCCCS